MNAIPIKFGGEGSAAIAAVDSLMQKIDRARYIATFNHLSDIRREALDILQEIGANDTGQLRGSIDSDARSIAEIPGIGGELSVWALHGIVIEQGRRPSGIPADVVLDNQAGLTAWVRRKMRPEQETKVGKSGLPLKRLTKEKFYEKVAKAIAWKKYHHPTPARPFIKPAIERAGGAQALRRAFEEALNAVIH